MLFMGFNSREIEALKIRFLILENSSSFILYV
jgi:hypothetical protein